MLYPKLKLITRKILEDRKLVLQMMNWRIKSQWAYVDQSPITEETYIRWLNNHVFEKFRFFYLIIGDDGLPIGHIGLYRFKGRTCEIDNVLRGVDKYKGYIGKALEKLIVWTYKYLPVSKIYLRVLKTNFKAIGFYKKHNFISLKEDKLFLKMKYENKYS